MTAIEWFSNRAYELFEEYSEGKFDRITLNKLMLEATDQAKEMEKEQSEKYANYVLELFEKDTNPMSFNLWNKTYGGKK